MHKAAVMRICAIYKGDTPDVVLFVVDSQAQDGVIRAALVDIPDLYSKLTVRLAHVLVELLHLRSHAQRFACAARGFPRVGTKRLLEGEMAATPRVTPRIARRLTAADGAAAISDTACCEVQVAMTADLEYATPPPMLDFRSPMFLDSDLSSGPMRSQLRVSLREFSTLLAFQRQVKRRVGFHASA